MMCAVCMFDGRRQEELIDLKDGQIDALRASNERLRADAERYRWLRSSCSLARDELVQALTGKWPDDDDGEAMDAAIDAALAEGEKP